MKETLKFQNLFCESYNVYRVSDYSVLTQLVKEFIEHIEGYFEISDSYGEPSHEVVCLKFVHSIINYAKAVLDNIYLGHFKAANMLNRAIIENFVCLQLMMKYESDSLWKYWIVHSYYNAASNRNDRKFPDSLNPLMNSLIEYYQVDKNWCDKFIERNNSWVYPVTQKFSFKALCDLVEPKIYNDYSIMCEYSHGSSYFQKDDLFDYDGAMGTMISIMCTYLQLMLYSVCPDLVLKHTEDLFDQIHEYIKTMCESE